LLNRDWPTSAATWLVDGAPPRPNAMFANPAYADTLERLVHEAEAAGADRQAQLEGARRAWRSGFVAEALAAFATRAYADSSGEPHAGLLTGDDLAGWEATWEPAATLDWNGHTVAKTGPWGQGPVLLQALATLSELGDPGD